MTYETKYIINSENNKMTRHVSPVCCWEILYAGLDSLSLTALIPECGSEIEPYLKMELWWLKPLYLKKKLYEYLRYITKFQVKLNTYKNNNKIYKTSRRVFLKRLVWIYTNLDVSGLTVTNIYQWWGIKQTPGILFCEDTIPFLLPISEKHIDMATTEH